MNRHLINLSLCLLVSGHLCAMQKAYSEGMVRNPLNPSFLRASKEGDRDQVEALIDEGADPSTVNAKNQTALHIATIHGRTSVVQFLLKEGADPEVTDDDECTPLHYAAMHGYFGCTQLLINAGADPLARDTYRYTPLHRAMQAGNAGLISTLLKTKAREQLAAKDEENTTALHLAALCGYKNCVKALLNNSLIANRLTKSLMIPLHCAASGGHYNLISLLGERAIVEATTLDGRTALHYAVSQTSEKFTKTVDELIKIKVPLDVIDKTDKKETALHTAARKGHLDQVELLLAAGADCTIEDAQGKSAFEQIITTLLVKNSVQSTADTQTDAQHAYALAKKQKLTEMSNLFKAAGIVPTKKRKRVVKKAVENGKVRRKDVQAK